MSFDEKDIDITKIFTTSLSIIANQASSPEELVKMWVSIGKRIGIESIVPHLKVVMYEYEKEGEVKQDIVGIIASPSSDVTEHLSSEDVFDEMLCQSSVRGLEIIRGARP